MADLRLVRAVVSPRTGTSEFVVEEGPSGPRRQIVINMKSAVQRPLMDKWWEAVVGEVAWQRETGDAG